MNPKEVKKKVLLWANERRLLDEEGSKKQLIKLFEESGELANAELRDNKEDIKDALGDMMVVMTILAHQKRLDLFECYESAYNVIKDREGKTINGVFIKD